MLDAADLWLSTDLAVLTDGPANRPAFKADGKVFYLLTPPVWAWVRNAINAADDAIRSKNDPKAVEEFREACERFTAIREWVTQRYTKEELRAARPKLPSPPVGREQEPGDYRFPVEGAPMAVRLHQPPVPRLTTDADEADLDRLAAWFMGLPSPPAGSGPIRLGRHRVVTDPSRWFAWMRERLAEGGGVGQLRIALLAALRAAEREMRQP